MSAHYEPRFEPTVEYYIYMQQHLEARILEAAPRLGEHLTGVILADAKSDWTYCLEELAEGKLTLQRFFTVVEIGHTSAHVHLDEELNRFSRPL